MRDSCAGSSQLWHAPGPRLAKASVGGLAGRTLRLAEVSLGRAASAVARARAAAMFAHDAPWALASSSAGAQSGTRR
eukprot:2076633-Pleurochrysis_carterae.AAC.1